MYKVHYTYSHPTAIIPVVQFDEADWAARNAFVTYAAQHGLITTETRLINPQTLVHEAVWQDKASFDAAVAHAGPTYAAWVLSVKNRIENGGGTYEVQEVEEA